MSMPESPREGVLAAITSVCFSVKRGERSIFTGTEESGLGVRRGLVERKLMCCVGCLDISSPHPKTTLTASRRTRRGAVSGSGAVRGREQCRTGDIYQAPAGTQGWSSPRSIKKEKEEKGSFSYLNLV